MFRKISCALIAFVMVALLLPVGLMAADTTLTDPGFTYSGVDHPVPLLVLVVSYDADGDGKDAFEEGYDTTSSSSPAYKEQWAHTEASYWNKILFGEDGYTMKNYFKLMSNDKFWFVPAEETQGTANDGIVYVTLNEQHPGTSPNVAKADIGATRMSALKAADEYVDFSKYDTDGNGGLSWKELSVLYIIGGRSSKLGMPQNAQDVWTVSNFKSNGTTWYPNLDGVRVMCGSDGASYSAVGEMQAQNQPLAFGSIAHELCHVLGANDLYTYSGYTWCGSPGNIAIQGGGSGNGETKGVKKGVAPSAIDPYYLTYFGFQGVTIAKDGEYTLYSRESKKGEYNIIRINTNNPKEYYLIENRHTVTPETFDAIEPEERGIQIWHVDEGIMESETLPNCWKGAEHAPGLTPVCSNGVSGRKAWDNTNGNNLFDCRNYTFAGSKTWYTQMSDEEAKNFNVKVEILDAKGNEMRIKISGTVAQPTYSNLYVSSPSYGELDIYTTINIFNDNTVTGGKLSVYTDEAMTNLVTSVDAAINGTRSLAAKITGLQEYTRYYYKFETIGSNGTEVSTGAYTVSGKPVEKTSYKLLFYTNGAGKRSYGITVQKGEAFNLEKLPAMKKTGYVFCGWYTEEECTNRYNLLTIEEECVDIPLYPRWEKEDEAITIVLKNAESSEPLFGMKVGDTLEEIVPVAQAGKTFEGWYTDEALTNRFSFSDELSAAGEIVLYAKWTNDGGETSGTTETTSTTATSATATASDSASNTTDSSNSGTTEGKSNTAVIVIIVIVAAAAVAAVAVVLIKKKK